MRKRISEQNVFPNFDLFKEYRKIEKYLSEYDSIIDFTGKKYTCEDYFDQFCFKNWNLRGTFFDLEEMRRSIGVSKDSISYLEFTEEQLLDFLQYALNILFRVFDSVTSKAYYSFCNEDTFNMVIQNIDYLLDKFNCKISEDDKTKEYYLEYKDDISEIISSEYPEIKTSIGEYKRINTQGNLIRKSEILCTLYKSLESVENKLKACNFSKIYEDTKFMFNKSGIRHWVEKDKTACATFLKMNEKEIEEWYDKIFNMFLTCMVLAKYIDNMQDVKDIKRAIGD